VHDGGATVESFRDRDSEDRRVHQLDGGARATTSHRRLMRG
jgi:hypothetical protein